MADTYLGSRLASNQRTFDYLLEAQASVTKTSTFNSTGVAFDIRKHLGAVLVLIVSAINAGDGDETYVPSVGVSDAVGGTYTQIAELANLRDAGTGQYIIPLSGEVAEKLDADCDFVRLTMTIGGTTPSITYHAYIAKA